MAKNPNFRPRHRQSKQTWLGSGTSFYHTKIRPHITKKRAIMAGAVMFVALLALPVVTYAYFARDIGNKERLMNRNNTGIILKDKNGTTFYSSGVLSTKDDLPLSQISDNLEKAVIASEDQSFYTNSGFSITGIAGALLGNVKQGDATGAGGSTLTQQLVKNKLLNSIKNYIRKYQEISMAVAVDQKYSKQEILEMYLNSVYFGDGAFGVSDAAKTYFNKAPADLTLAESSMLIGILPAPSAYSPVSGDKTKAKAAQKNVLRKMVDTKAITGQERDEALKVELAYTSAATKAGAEHAQHFADMVVDELEEKYGEERVKRSGFEVTTTLDLTKQSAAEKIVSEQVAKTASRGGRNAGLVAMNPKTGQVEALVGSVDYFDSGFGQVNMAMALRQPGSSFKPIYYTEAIDKGLVTAATIMNDKQTTYGGTYKPNNYDNRFKGEMSVRSALAESRNIPAVDIMQKVGVSNAANVAKRMGITSVTEPDKYGLTLALGTAEVRLFQMTNAYAAFANGGKQFKPILYTKIVDKYGEDTTDLDKNEPRQVVSESAAYITSSILSDTAARAPTYGSSLNLSGRTAALKTGTTNDSRDAWTIGYTPSIVVGVWLGNNENQPMTGGIAGGSGAGTIWKRAMTSFLANSKREEFVKPSAVKAVTICIGTDLRSVNEGGQSTKTEYFMPNKEPSGVCNDKKQEVKPDTSAEDKEKEKKKQEETKPPAETDDELPTETPPTDDGTGDEPDPGTGGSTTPPPTSPTQTTPRSTSPSTPR